jgi:hypothetical protein
MTEAKSEPSYMVLFTAHLLKTTGLLKSWFKKGRSDFRTPREAASHIFGHGAEDWPEEVDGTGNKLARTSVSS